MIYELLDAAGWLFAPVWAFLGTGLVHGTALALITFVLTVTVLRRARPALIAALWTIVLLKFALPMGPEVPVSVSGVVDAAFAGEAAVPQSTHAYVAARITASSRVLVPVETSTAVWQAVQLGLLSLYLIGLFVVARRRLRAQARLRHRARSLPVASESMGAAVADVADRVGLRRLPEIRVSDAGAPPHLVGAARPILIVPADWDDSEAREAALIHELAHLRRGDTWLRVFQLAMGTVLYFFPVVWWVNRRLDCAREMACDQWAIEHGRLGRRGYAHMLVSAVRRYRPTPAAAVGLTAAPAQLEARIDALRVRRRSHRVGFATGLVLALWAVVSLGSSDPAEAHALDGRQACGALDNHLKTLILVEYPEADTDGDGELSRKEICDHQERMERRLAGGVASTLDASAPVSWLDPVIDQNDNGVLEENEIAGVAEIVHISVKTGTVQLDPVDYPGRICALNDRQACMKENQK